MSVYPPCLRHMSVRARLRAAPTDPAGSLRELLRYEPRQLNHRINLRGEWAAWKWCPRCMREQEEL